MFGLLSVVQEVNFPDSNEWERFVCYLMYCLQLRLYFIHFSERIIAGGLVWLVSIGCIQVVILYECCSHKWCIGRIPNTLLRNIFPLALPVPLAFAFFSLFTSIGFFVAAHIQSTVVELADITDVERDVRDGLYR